jgi:hypothetical protein
MAIDDDITSAVRKGLADYLRSTIMPQVPTDATTGATLLTVREKWPPAGQKLNQYDITVLATGETDDWWFFLPSAKQVTPAASPQGLIAYSYGYIDGLQLDLDCFGSNQVASSALNKLMRSVLNQPPWVTAPAVPKPKWLTLGHTPGLILQLTTFFNTLVDYEFTPVSAPVETSDAAEVGEWRSHYRGKATLGHMSTARTTPRRTTPSRAW